MRRGTPGSVGHLTVGPMVLHHKVDVDQGLVSLDNMMQGVVTSLNSCISKMSVWTNVSSTSGLPLSQETQ